VFHYLALFAIGLAVGFIIRGIVYGSD